MFNKILIANRGEIACRVIKTARRMGVATVAVYSDADRDALHVRLADEAIHIGAAPARESYLLGDRILEAALATNADAVHPGYGFLSENAGFARACAEQGVVFIGPPTEAIEAMGSKSAAKRIMEKAKVPLVPGYHGDDQDPALLRASAEEMGYPVLLKATAGGGGKGMRQVWSGEEFDEALAAAKRESMSSFGDDTMLVEKYLTKPRHVEFQVFCDNDGNGVYLAERDCSVQRRHQKIVEEAPSPAIDDAKRKHLAEAAVQAAVAAGYRNVGTLEFLVDGEGNYFFIEINARIQVEHPVTEELSGIDIVAEQIRLAAGEELGYGQDAVRLRGHAIEFRINAEDVKADFQPQAGRVEHYVPPGGAGIRMETHLYSGYDVPPYYDSLLGKLIVWGPDRETAVARSRVALQELLVEGIETNIPFHRAILQDETFLSGGFDTNLLDRKGAAAFISAAAPDEGA
jgi:3-methylcrotonyl-CoA carboxylase alpha subunit